jgi:hypothetical protein
VSSDSEATHDLLGSAEVTAAPKPTLVTMPEAARQLGISARTIQR